MTSNTNRWALASSNPRKLEEINALTSKLPIQIISQSELGIESPAEIGQTFCENALIKARHTAKLAGLPTIADDSGLTVDALGGKPGIHSARYAGPIVNDKRNVEKLLMALNGIPQSQRNAQFRCVIVALRHQHDPTPLICHGEWAGRIADRPSGDGGFGYDPVFFDPRLCATAAEIPLDTKNQVSHRALALAKLLQKLEIR